MAQVSDPSAPNQPNEPVQTVSHDGTNPQHAELIDPNRRSARARDLPDAPFGHLAISAMSAYRHENRPNSLHASFTGM